MNTESNRPNLKKAITRLPHYEPPDTIWTAINTELDFNEKIKDLPVYTPKEEVWEQINQQLSTHEAPVFSIKKWAIAATILLCLSINFWLYHQPKSASLSYAVENIDQQLFEADWDEDESLFEEINAICQTNTYSCTLQEFQVLEKELNELNVAKSDLKQAINNFGKDTELISQLSEIELERTMVLKKMIATIL